MKLWLNEVIGEALRECTAEAAMVARPHLSCELGGLNSAQAKELLLAAFRDWERNLMVGYFRIVEARKERVRACLFDIYELASIIDSALKSEDVVSVVDIAAMGGCAFDLSPEEQPNENGTVELLLTGWGAHEATIVDTAKRFRVPTFRQGESVGLK